jgi:hypothetical protein
MITAATLLAAGLTLVGGCEDDSDVQPPKTPAEVADTARAVKETAQATTAIMRLNGATGGNDSLATPLVPDPTLVPSVDGDGAGDLLEDLLEGLLGF